jgi:hypothetical protein
VAALGASGPAASSAVGPLLDARIGDDIDEYGFGDALAHVVAGPSAAAPVARLLASSDPELQKLALAFLFNVGHQATDVLPEVAPLLKAPDPDARRFVPGGGGSRRHLRADDACGRGAQRRRSGRAPRCGVGPGSPPGVQEIIRPAVAATRPRPAAAVC